MLICVSVCVYVCLWKADGGTEKNKQPKKKCIRVQYQLILMYYVLYIIYFGVSLIYFDVNKYNVKLIHI